MWEDNWTAEPFKDKNYPGFESKQQRNIFSVKKRRDRTELKMKKLWNSIIMARLDLRMRLRSKIDNFLTDTFYACIKIGQSYCVLRGPCERAFRVIIVEDQLFGLDTFSFNLRWTIRLPIKKKQPLL